MQYFLYALLFLPFLLHGYVLVKQQPQLDPASIDSHRLSQVKNEKPLENATVVVKTDDSMSFSSPLTNSRYTNSFSNPDDPVKQFAAGSAVSLPPGFTTTNVMLEPQKRDGVSVDVGVDCECGGCGLL